MATFDKKKKEEKRAKAKVSKQKKNDFWCSFLFLVLFRFLAVRILPLLSFRALWCRFVPFFLCLS